MIRILFPKTILTLLFFLLNLSLFSQKQEFNPIADVYIRGGESAEINFNNHADGLVVKQGSVENFFRKSLLKFDISSLSLNKVGSAQLLLYCYKTEKQDVNTTIDAYSVNSEWDENEVTWKNAPVLMNVVGTALAKPGRYFSISVTEYIKEKLNEESSVLSIGLFDRNASNNGVFMMDSNGGYPPVLVIDEEEEEQPSVITSARYVDADNGDDMNDGKSEESAWRSLNHVNSHIYGPGAQLLFKAGNKWSGTLQPIGEGNREIPFIIGSYGNGPKPLIDGAGAAATIHLRNCQYITLKNIEITNYDPSEEGGLSLAEWEERNITEWWEVDNPPQYVSGNRYKIGVRITASDMGEVNNIHLKNLHVHAVNGAIDQDSESTKNNGGIFIEITGNSTPTWFNGLRIEECHIHDVDRTGLSNTSSWSSRTLTEPGNWTPSLNVVIRNNIFERSGANALIVRVSKDPIIEHNLFHQNGIKASGNAAFNFNTDGALWQFNEARFTKKNQGDADAGGIDSDYRTKGTIIQYNYIHDNDFGMLVTGGPLTYNGFNDSTIVRYNIIERDGNIKPESSNRFTFKSSGRTTNLFVHNNVFYLSPEQSNINLTYHKNWGGSPIRTYYYNNIYYLEGNNHGYDFGNSVSTSFFNNIYFGNSTVKWPDISNNLIKDPQFKSVGEGAEGYKITDESPAIDYGVVIEKIGTAQSDYYGNEVPRQSPVDAGVHQFSNSSSNSGEMFLNPDDRGNINIKPMPVREKLNLTLTQIPCDTIDIYLVSIDGKNIFLGSHGLVDGRGELSINLSDDSLKRGIYLLKIVSEDFNFSKKIIYSGSL